jgi:hypothetical protein
LVDDIAGCNKVAQKIFLKNSKIGISKIPKMRNIAAPNQVSLAKKENFKKKLHLFTRRKSQKFSTVHKFPFSNLSKKEVS